MRTPATVASAVPRRWRGEIESILIPPATLRRRVKELAREIQRDFERKDFVMVALLNGTVLFLADLMRCIQLPLRLDLIGVSSYGAGTTSKELAFTKELRLDVRGRHVLLIDDILDTGRTFQAAIGKIEALKPASIRTCVLLDKPARRVVAVHPDYVGFEIPDVFVVGYGLDFAERFRNLPFVGVLRAEAAAKK
jgi:hypoxanthine phosphoribosyltransferase